MKNDDTTKLDRGVKLVDRPAPTPEADESRHHFVIYNEGPDVPEKKETVPPKTHIQIIKP